MACSEYLVYRLFHSFHDQIQDARIDRILKIGDKNIAFILYKNGKTKTLLLSLNPPLPIFLLGEDVVSFIEESHGFFSVLKKYIEHGSITSFEKVENDRILIFHIKKRLPTYVYEETKLVFELIPLRANLILLNKDDVILDAYHKSEGFDAKNPIIKGIKYHFISLDKKPLSLDDSLNEIQYKVSKQEFSYLSTLSEEEFKKAKENLLYGNNFYVTNQDISLLPLMGSKKVNLKELLSSLLEEQKKVSLNNQYKDVIHYIDMKIHALKRKKKRMEQELISYEEESTYLNYGSLLYMGSSTYKKGDDKVEIEGVMIPLKKDKNLSQNAEEYFKKYRKAKNGKIKLKEQMEKTDLELAYFEELALQCKFASQEDYQDIIEQLSEDQYFKRKQKHEKKNKKKEFHPHFIDYMGVKIGFGLSSYQNDYLTFTLAHKDYYFLHIKDGHGPHVIIFTNNPSDEVLLLAAESACYFASSLGDVYYTMRKNVKKIPAKSGLVEINQYQIIHINKIREESIKLFTNIRN